jgi:hypothetical protein
MIILYVILLNYTNIPGEELLWEVQKSYKMLRSMEEASVRLLSDSLHPDFNVSRLVRYWLLS